MGLQILKHFEVCRLKMFRLFVNAVCNRTLPAIKNGAWNIMPSVISRTANFSGFSPSIHVAMQPMIKNVNMLSTPYKSLLLNSRINEFLNGPGPCRGLIKYSYRKGKRKSVKPVVKRFYRLNWGIWIRTRSGRHRKIWKKSRSAVTRSRHHVFVNATQSWLLDTMVTKFWRKPKYWVDDPYAPYHSREEFQYTAKKPWQYY